MSFAVAQDLHNKLSISIVAHLTDGWLVLVCHLQHIIQHILHLRFSTQMQKSILELIPALGSKSKYPIFHYSHKILHSCYVRLWANCSAYQLISWLEISTEYIHLILSISYENSDGCTCCHAQYFCTLTPQQQGLQLWLHQLPTAILIRLVCTAWHHMGGYHHSTNRPNKWTLYIQGREETHNLKIKFAVNLCQVLSVKNDRGHGLLSDWSHQKPVWLTSLPTDYCLQIHRQLAYNRMGPVSEGSQRLKTGACSHHGVEVASRPLQLPSWLHLPIPKAHMLNFPKVYR